MKTPLTLLLFFICTHICFAQTNEALKTISATYQVTKTLHSINEFKDTINRVQVELRGKLYVQSNKSMYWEEPMYLSTYQDGKVAIQTLTGLHDYKLPTDSMQNIRLNDAANGIWIGYSTNTFNGVAENTLSKGWFKPANRSWQFLPETKVVGGLSCQRAQLFYNKRLAWDVWFCPEIPIAVGGPLDICNLPGLVVAATNFISSKQILLSDYKMAASLPQHLFWPEQFNQPFTNDYTTAH